MVVVILIDVGLLAAGIPAKRGRLRERRDALTRSINELEKNLPLRQKESDDARQVILDAVDALDELLNLGRRSEDIAAAQQKLPAALQLMDAARGANARLPVLTEQIVTMANRGMSDSSGLMALVDEQDARYLGALSEALGVMIETHKTYSAMNALLDQGLKVYDELASLTNDYLTKQSSGFFRNNLEATRWYTLRADALLTRIEGFKADLQETNFQAQEAAVRAGQAFDRVEELADR